MLDSVGYRRKLQEIDTAILANADFLNKIVANPEIFGHDVSLGEDGGVEEGMMLEDPGRPLTRSAGLDEQGRLDSGVDSMFSFFFFQFSCVFSGKHDSRLHRHSHNHPHDAKTANPRKQLGQGQGRYRTTDFDIDKLRSTLKQFVRDWSEDVRISVIQRLFAVHHRYATRGKPSVMHATGQ